MYYVRVVNDQYIYIIPPVWEESPGVPVPRAGLDWRPAISAWGGEGSAGSTEH